MSETTTLAQTLPEQQTETQGRPEMTINGNGLGNNFFGIEEKTDTTQTQTQQQTQTTETKPAATTTTEVKPEEKLLQSEPWFKGYGFEDETKAKEEINNWKTRAEKQPEEQKFENDESKKVYELARQGKVKEVVKIFQQQEQIDNVLALEVNETTAADVIKLGMKLKYPSLSDGQIEFKFNEDYGVPKEPKEPVQRKLEEDDEFSERMDEYKEKHQEWENKVKGISTKLTIDATMTKPEIEAAKTKIVLPDISGQVQQKQPTQEELDAAKKYHAAYVQSVDSSLKEFNGFSVTIKNEDVGLPEIQIPYAVIDGEKSSLSKELKDFSQQGYNTNALFAQRWVNEDGTLNTTQIAEDRYLIQNRDKILQKMTLDAATKAIESYIKGKKNINVNETSNPGTAQINKEDKTEMDTVRDQFFG